MSENNEQKIINKDLDCCTHYNRQGYYTGYVMLPVFRVPHLPELRRGAMPEWGRAANLLFMGLLRWFWSGKVHILGRWSDDESKKDH